jgi:hypothetical protein
VVNDVDTSFEIFNSSRTLAATINVLNQVNAGGFTFLVGKIPPSPELTIAIQGSELYTLRAEAEVGPPTINATFTWVPSAPFNAVSVNFTGNRITILAFEPQVGPLTEYAFITSIVESYNGTEQRMAMRDRPRQAMTYTYRMGDGGVDIEEPYYAEAQAFEHVMFDSIGRVFALPVWEDRTVLTAAVAPTDTVLNLVTAGLDLQEGRSGRAGGASPATRSAAPGIETSRRSATSSASSLGRSARRSRSGRTRSCTWSSAAAPTSSSSARSSWRSRASRRSSGWA